MNAMDIVRNHAPAEEDGYAELLEHYPGADADVDLGRFVADLVNEFESTSDYAVARKWLHDLVDNYLWFNMCESQNPVAQMIVAKS